MMILYILSIVMIIRGDSLFSGEIYQAEVSKKGIFSGYVIEKVSGDVKGETVSDAEGEYIAVDGAVYYKGKAVIKKENRYVRLAGYKGYTLALFIPDGVIYVLYSGKIKDSLKLEIKGVSDIKTSGLDIYLFSGGDIYTVQLSGNYKKFASFPVKNITDIVEHNGKLYVITSEPGRVYEKFGKDWRVYYDPNLTEINAIGFIGDTMFVSGNVVQGDNLQGKVFAVYSGEEREVYKGTGIISGAKTWRGFICGDGEDGQVAVFHTDGFTLIQDLKEKEITDIHQENGIITICTGKPAGVYHMKKIKSKEGYYTTKVIDGGFGVVWGKIDWEGRGSVKIKYRTGRTAKLDTTWTSWRSYSGRIDSEDRYLMVKFIMTSGSDFIKSIEINYQPRNHPPEIKDFGILPPGIGYGNAENTPFDREMMGEEDKAKWEDLGFIIPDGSFKVKRGNLRCVWWNATDKDGDRLIFSIYLKKDGGQYKLLSDKIEGNAYFIDVSTYPEGKYQLKLVAKDYPTSFYPDSDYVEEGLLIDNTPPTLSTQGLKKGWFYGVAEDKLSRIYRVFYKFENEEWFAALPLDGVYDEKKEGFKFMVPEGKRSCAVKVEDGLGNFRVMPVSIR